MSALHDIKYKAHGQDANKAQGEAERLISIEAAHRVRFISRKARVTQCFYFLKNFQRNALI